jgi:hypothetical protein
MSYLRIIYMSSYKLQRFCALTFCLLLAAPPACARAGGKNYFPLVDGATWEYSGHFLPSTGGQYPARATIHIDGITLIHNRRYYKYVTSSVTDAPNIPKLEQVRYFRVEATAIYFLQGNDLDGKEQFGMPLPIPVGERWLSGTSEVIAERAGTVEVGGHKYADCLKLTYKEPDGKHTMEEYLAPGVGMIKTIYTNTTPPQSTFELTLESYHL